MVEGEVFDGGLNPRGANIDVHPQALRALTMVFSAIETAAGYGADHG